MTEKNWSEACEDAWLSAHNYANEKNVAGVLSSLLTLFVAMQYESKENIEKIVLQVYLKLRLHDSPIYLLARKPIHKTEKYYFPVVEKDKVLFKQVENQLFVQLETSSQHDVIIKEEWIDAPSHNAALCSAGFHLPATAIAHGKIL